MAGAGCRFPMVGGGGALGFPGGLGRGSAFDPALPMGPGEANPSIQSRAGEVCCGTLTCVPAGALPVPVSDRLKKGLYRA